MSKQATSSEIQSNLLSTLKQSDTDLSIAEVVDKTPYSRATVSKYLQVLVGKGEVTRTRSVGNSKFYTDAPKAE